MPTQLEQPLPSKKEVRKDFFRYLVPTIIGMVAHSFYCLADVFFVGVGVGSDGLAALNVALPIFTLYSCISIMIGIGAATTISVCRGAGDYDNTNRVFTQAIVLNLILGVLLTVLTSVFLEDIALLLGATPRIAQGVVDYLSPINRLVFVYILSGSLGIIVRSDGNPKLVMIAGTVGNLCNIFLDYVFVLKMDMGLFGAGLATIIGPCLTVAILSLHFFKHANNVLFVKKFFSFPLLVRTLKNGVGSSILEISNGFIIFMFNVVLLRVSGEVAVAVFSIISNIGYVGKGIFNGMAQAAQPIISLNYGARKYSIVKLVNNYALTTALVFGVVIYALVAMFPSQIITLFISHEESMVQMGTRGILLYFLSFPFTGMNTILMYYFQSLERSAYTTVMAILRGIVLVYGALMLFSFLWGEQGVWISLFVAEGITFLTFFPIKTMFEKKLLKKAFVPKDYCKTKSNVL